MVQRKGAGQVQSLAQQERPEANHLQEASAQAKKPARKRGAGAVVHETVNGSAELNPVPSQLQPEPEPVTHASAESRFDTRLPDSCRILKKYPNRRLYDTHTSAYITLADVKEMVLSSTDFVVRDAKSGEDLTRSILLQIILEEETGGVPLFSSQALAHIIRFYGHSMQSMMGSYLEKNLQILTEFQTRLADQAVGLYDPRLLGADAWAKMLASGPATAGMPQMMGSVLGQSTTALSQMQEQLNKQAQTLFAGFLGLKPPRE
jgi:polyhydroxyalkanoate synthesis repressor PhaR